MNRSSSAQIQSYCLKILLSQNSAVFASLSTEICAKLSKVLSGKRRLWGHWLYLAGLRLDDGSPLVVATDHAPATAISNYALR
jgi:hypothetical protein